MIDGLTIGLFILGAFLLGKQFAMKSVISTIVYPVFVTGLSQVATMFPKDTFVMPAYVATIYAGVLVGIGLGLVFRVNSSTGGMDILALILHKYLKIPEGTSVMIVDGLTVLLGVVTHGLTPALIGIMSVFVCGIAIDKTVMLGMQSAKNVMIISTEWKQIRRILLETVDRGVTILDGSGGYTQAPKPVLMCVIKQKQYPLLESSVLEIDPKAFIIVNDVHQVHGAGLHQNMWWRQMKQHIKEIIVVEGKNDTNTLQSFLIVTRLKRVETRSTRKRLSELDRLKRQEV